MRRSPEKRIQQLAEWCESEKRTKLLFRKLNFQQSEKRLAYYV